MNSEIIAKNFMRMGARFTVARPESRRWFRSFKDYALDIGADRHGQYFQLVLSEQSETQLEVQVLQCDRQDRHLLLLVKTPEVKDRFLCGHDEREWFVAAVAGAVSTVTQAKLALQPAEVRQAGDSASLNLCQRTRRHNRAFIRQGEWFFVPAPWLHVDNNRLLTHEPINRSGGKPHYVAELYRTGGEAVFINSRYPGGLTKAELDKLKKANPSARSWNWESRTRNAGVYARGTVRHPDHATIHLRGWHRVLMNTENQSRQMANVAFID